MHRTTAGGAILLTLLTALSLAAVSSSNALNDPDPQGTGTASPIIFPVVGGHGGKAQRREKGEEEGSSGCRPVYAQGWLGESFSAEMLAPTSGSRSKGVTLPDPFDGSSR